MRKGSTVSEESRRRMSLAKIGKPSNWKGRKASPESIEKMRLAKLGVPKTKEHNEKNRQGQIRRYLKLNPDYKTAGRNKRIIENGGFHTVGEWNNLKVQYNWRCPSCLQEEPDIKLTKDHIIPLMRGGSNNIENIQPLCGRCNQLKHTQIIKYPITN